jgi:hypothetical protein
VAGLEGKPVSGNRSSLPGLWDLWCVCDQVGGAFVHRCGYKCMVSVRGLGHM